MPIDVFGVVNRVLDKLAPLAQGIKDVDDEVIKIRVTLNSINAVILGAQERQLTEIVIQSWLEELKAVAYEIDDLIDIVSTQKLEDKVNDISFRRSMANMSAKYDVSQELKSIRQRLDEINSKWRNYGFQVPCGIISVEPTVQRQNYSYVAESEVIGRKQDKQRIIGRLLGSLGDDADHLHVIPLIGIGGMGKTTLATVILNDPDIVGSFEMRLWATVSDNFDLKILIEGILQDVTGIDFSHLNMKVLQDKLIQKLSGQKYFLVLDDVCITDVEQWINLKRILAVGSPKSRILATTREERVASIIGTDEAYQLQGLSEDDCWSIFASHAFCEDDEKTYPELTEIGKSIVQKCHGVPLVARTLGALLSDDRDYRYWKRIEESDLWKTPQDPNRIMSALKLSYDRIPYPLRACFAMCAVYQKGHPLFRIDVINMWMALGLLQSREGSEPLEEIGDRYFNKLLATSLFQSPGYDVAKKVVNDYGEIFVCESSFWNGLVQMFEGDLRKTLNSVLHTFFQPAEKLFFLEMHDLVHDLASYVSKDEIAIINSVRQKVSTAAMHILWNHDDLSRFPLLEGKRWRLFAFARPVSHVSKNFLHGLIRSLKFLRILDLSFSEFEELPESLGFLRHLRYLKLGWNSKLIGLPGSTSNLVNLQSLDLFRCVELGKIPNDMHRLVNLRFLSLTAKLEHFSPSVFGLISLRVLKLSFCQNLISLPEEIGNLKNLLDLEIFCCACLVRLPNEMKDLTCLERLSVFCCQRLDLEDWEGLYGLKNLRYLDLNELPELAVFPRGLQAVTSLHDLRIQKCGSLRTLREGLRGCTSLLRLTLTGCPVLTHIPRGVRNLKKLQQVNIDGCDELETRCVQDGSDWSLISHVPKIIINRQVLKY